MDRTAVRGETELGETVREASMRLPERQREALALSGLERRSYEEIAASMETSAAAVAQLISRARINLYDELRGTALASVAAPSPACERALPLVAAREDGQLDSGPDGDAAWLDAHLTGCDRCRLGAEQMREVNDAYRGGAPVDAPEESSSGAALANPSARSRVRLSRGQATFAGALGVLLLLGGLATAFVGDDGSPAPATPAADAATGRGIEKPGPDAKPVMTGGEGGTAKERAKGTTAAETNGDGAAAADAVRTPVTVPAQPPTGGDAPSESPSGPTRPSGKAGIEPTKQTSAPKSTSEPKPAPTATPTSQPASGPTPEAPPPAEEPPDGPGRSDEAPGKPSDHPPR